MAENQEFSRRWAKQRKDRTTILNSYELDTDGLQIKRFTRNEEWFQYIYQNRNGQADALTEYDVIIGPIANDTIYDTFGIVTSGMLPREHALQLLLIGPVYEQTVLKTEKAAAQLTWLSAEILRPEDVARFRETVHTEEAAFQTLFAKTLEALVGDKNEGE